MKKLFTTPTVELIIPDVADILTLSGGDDTAPDIFEAIIH